MLHLARFDEFLHRSGYVLDGDVWIDPVLIEQIDGVYPEALQRFLSDLFNALGTAIETSPSGTTVGVELKTELRGDHHLPPKGNQGFSHQLLVGKRPIDLSGIEEGDAPLHCRMKKRDHLRLVANRFIRKGLAHAAESEGRDFQATLSKCALLHGLNSALSMKACIDGFPRSALVLFVADLFHPVNCLAVESLLNGDVRHGRGWRGAMPMFLPRLKQDHIAWSNLLDGSPPTLCPATASRHDQGLAQRVGVPGSPSAWLERHTGTSYASRIGCFKQGVDADRAGKILGWSFTGWL